MIKLKLSGLLLPGEQQWTHTRWYYSANASTQWAMGSQQDVKQNKMICMCVGEVKNDIEGD